MPPIPAEITRTTRAIAVAAPVVTITTSPSPAEASYIGEEATPLGILKESTTEIVLRFIHWAIELARKVDAEVDRA
jgi:hypothetical protein